MLAYFNPDRHNPDQAARDEGGGKGQRERVLVGGWAEGEEWKGCGGEVG